MRNENGKTPLAWIVTIAVSLVIAGVTVAMLFADNEDVSKMIEGFLNKNNKVQTENK